jgi:hypothetical protein
VEKARTGGLHPLLRMSAGEFRQLDEFNGSAMLKSRVPKESLWVKGLTSIMAKDLESISIDALSVHQAAVVHFAGTP